MNLRNRPDPLNRLNVLKLKRRDMRHVLFYLAWSGGVLTGLALSLYPGWLWPSLTGSGLSRAWQVWRGLVTGSVVLFPVHLFVCRRVTVPGMARASLWVLTVPLVTVLCVYLMRLVRGGIRWRPEDAFLTVWGDYFVLPVALIWLLYTFIVLPVVAFILIRHPGGSES